MALLLLVPIRLALALVVFAATPIVIAQDSSDEGGDATITLGLNSQQRKENGVVIATAGKRSFKERFTAPAEVVLNAYSSSEVTPRIASHALARYALLGEKVLKDQPLARLSSVKMAEAQGELIIAANEWRRVQKLGRETISDRRYTEAQVAIQQAAAKVQTFGMTQSQVKEFLASNDVSQATGAYDLLSPQNGTVISDEFLVGERIEPGQVLFKLTDESSLWVEARLTAGDSRRIVKSTPARVSVDGVRWIDGEIVQIAHSLDDQTRTRAIRIEIDNREDQFHPGEFVQVEFRPGTGDQVLAVPAPAIVTLEQSPAVFRMVARDELIPVSVETGRTDGSWVEIRAGISDGDEIAVEGAFALKAELLKLQGGD
jgi:cobalt-zinc-cadmium efflux system membrane fusion protein